MTYLLPTPFLPPENGSRSSKAKFAGQMQPSPAQLDPPGQQHTGVLRWSNNRLIMALNWNLQLLNYWQRILLSCWRDNDWVQRERGRAGSPFTPKDRKCNSDKYVLTDIHLQEWNLFGRSFLLPRYSFFQKNTWTFAVVWHLRKALLVQYKFFWIISHLSKAQHNDWFHFWLFRYERPP